MERLAQILWDPLLCGLYLIVGFYFVLLTRAAPWRRTIATFRSVWTARHATNPGEIAHKDAFLSALSASVGVGNLAGVATALHLGGPGALFWMWVSAAFGMYFRMIATYLAIKWRPRDPNSLAFATPMSYLERLLPPRWRGTAKVVAVLLLASGLINANLIQSNSVAYSLSHNFGVPTVVVAVVLSACVGAVILGGVSSIVRVSAAIAPSMVALYVGAGLIILLIHPLDTLDSLRSVFFYAFHPDAVVGGVSGYVAFRSLQYGISRGIFSHGSGVGMAPFFQAANTDHPLRGAFMAAAIPVVDTLIVCTITGLVILSHGFWQVWTSAHLTVSSFEAVLGASGKLVVFACLAVFAFTTMISWAHFSERCYAYLGGRNVGGYRLFFCGVTFCGPFLSVAFVWSMADVLMGSLLFVHLLALTVIATMRAPTILRDFG